MKMNDTVARIVDLMFENTEMTEEVAALRDEVMNNCQERYSDLVESGMPEDDAVGAVIESLKGMEDVIGQYSRKTRRQSASQPAPECAAEAAEAGQQHLVYAAGEIDHIDLTLVSENVTLEASDDHDYHVIWDAEEDPQIQAQVENGVLRIERRQGEWNQKSRTVKNFQLDARDGKNAHVYVNGDEVSFDEVGRVVNKAMDDVGSMMENLGRSLGRMFNGLRLTFNSGDGVTIQIPENAVPHTKLLTTSGDLSVQDVALADLNIVTTSGDIDIDLNEDQYLNLVQLRTTSGDVEATAFTHEMTIASTSGDVEVEGYHHHLTVNTISGDIDVRADVKNMAFKAVSGDVDLEFENEEIRDVQGSTISGDIDIDLPSGMGAIAIHTNTRSGDVTTRCHTNGHGPTVTGSVSSMSGDITIR